MTLHGKRCGLCNRLYRYLPGVLHSKGKLHKEGEQTEQRPNAAQRLASRL
jgi:hypothetical protein